jgi:hypothetical protein
VLLRLALWLSTVQRQVVYSFLVLSFCSKRSLPIVGAVRAVICCAAGRVGPKALTARA